MHSGKIHPGNPAFCERKRPRDFFVSPSKDYQIKGYTKINQRGCNVSSLSDSWTWQHKPCDFSFRVMKSP